VRLSEDDLSITYSVDVPSPVMQSEVRIAAVKYARMQLVKELTRCQYDVLLSEGWTVVTLRKAGSYRLRVQYRGQGAATSRRETGRTVGVDELEPPFLGILKEED